MAKVAVPTLAHAPSMASVKPGGVENGGAPNNQGEVGGDGYAVGQRVLCNATFDNEAHPAEIIERKADASASSFVYYVHYADSDKRLDEWVPAANVREALKPSDVVVSPRFAASTSGDLAQQSAGEAKAYATRTMKRRFEEIHHVAPDVEALPPIDQHFEKAHQRRTRVRNVQVVELGRHELDAWYYSPYPEPYGGCHRLYVCEWDLKYFRKKRTLLRHLASVQARGPPGDLIYESPVKPGARGHVGDGASRGPRLAMFEIDGAHHKLYCQNLCLLAKLFLDHKTLYFDVEPFLFYVLCERDAEGYHVAGYFSKEKTSPDNFNVACILTLPCHQRKGYGGFLIGFSYELSRREGKLGTPERPLSDLGAVSYRAYWTQEVFDALLERKNPTVKDVSEATGIRADDIIAALSPLGLVRYYRGDHLLAVTPKLIEDHLARAPVKKRIEVNGDLLKWEPRPPAPPCGGGPAAPLRSSSLNKAPSFKR